MTKSKRHGNTIPMHANFFGRHKNVTIPRCPSFADEDTIFFVGTFFA